MMVTVIALDPQEIRGGVLRKIKYRGAKPELGDECQVILNDFHFIMGYVVRVYYQWFDVGGLDV